MNERIRELALQAGIQFPNNLVEGVNGPGIVTEKDKLEKFAELIVRECGKVIVNGGYRNPAFSEKHPLTPPEIATMIKEHFGVEE